MMIEITKILQEDPEWKKQNEILEQKRLKAIETLGTKWLLHPSKNVQRKTAQKADA